MLRVLQMAPSLGPLLLMFFQMFKDVGQLLILEFFILAGFSAGISTLFSSRLFASVQVPSGAIEYNVLPLQCDEFNSLGGEFTSFSSVFYVFFNGVFTGSTHVRAPPPPLAFPKPHLPRASPSLPLFLHSSAMAGLLPLTSMAVGFAFIRSSASSSMALARARDSGTYRGSTRSHSTSSPSSSCSICSSP